MGVSRLHDALKPYRVLEPLRARDIVVDGPALAHHIYHRLFAAKSRARNYHEANPTYREVGEGVLRWLRDLGLSGAHVQRVYFDGYLPCTKVAERLRRRYKHATKLCQYHADFKDGVDYDTARTKAEQQAPSLKYDTPRSSLYRLPSSSFLVPSVIDVLSSTSDLRDTIHVVAGEADAFCAKFVQSSERCIVFTSDSDLLVYDVGQTGAVSYFEDLGVITQGKDKDSCDLQSYTYCPTAIARQLDLSMKDLTPVAFELDRDRKATFPQIFERARHVTLRPDDTPSFNIFRAGFSLSKVQDDSDASFVATGKHGNNIALDARVSEFVMQHYLQPEDGHRTVFLPLLIDHPMRVNAYESSLNIRRLAYSLMGLRKVGTDGQRIVYEYSRQTNSRNGRSVELFDDLAMLRESHRIVDILQAVKADFPALDRNAYWVSVSVYFGVLNCSNDAHLPRHDQRFHQAHSKDDTVLTWDVLHFLAKFQGLYYSFRMFRQITDFLLANNLADLPRAVLALRKMLDAMPSLTDLPDSEYAATELGKFGLQSIYGRAHAYFDLAYEPAPSKAESKISSTRCNDKPKVRVAEGQAVTKGSRFAMLSDDLADVDSDGGV